MLHHPIVITSLVDFEARQKLDKGRSGGEKAVFKQTFQETVELALALYVQITFDGLWLRVSNQRIDDDD